MSPGPGLSTGPGLRLGSHPTPPAFGKALLCQVSLTWPFQEFPFRLMSLLWFFLLRMPCVCVQVTPTGTGSHLPLVQMGSWFQGSGQCLHGRCTHRHARQAPGEIWQHSAPWRPHYLLSFASETTVSAFRAERRLTSGSPFPQNLPGPDPYMFSFPPLLTSTLVFFSHPLDLCWHAGA